MEHHDLAQWMTSSTCTMQKDNSSSSRISKEYYGDSEVLLE
jgi:hypothetical protein